MRLPQSKLLQGHNGRQKNCEGSVVQRRSKKERERERENIYCVRDEGEKRMAKKNGVEEGRRAFTVQLRAEQLTDFLRGCVCTLGGDVNSLDYL